MLRLLLPTSLILMLAWTVPVTPGADKETPASVHVDKAKKLLMINAKVAPRKIDDPAYKEIYPIEVIACWAFPRGQKAHETVVTIDAKPSEIHKGLVELGLKPGKPEVGDAKDAPSGPEVNIFLEFKNGDEVKHGADREDADRSQDQQEPAQAEMALYRIGHEQARPEQGGHRLWSRLDRNADRDFSGDQPDGVPDEPDNERRKVRQAGDGQEAAAQGRHAGQADHRIAERQVTPQPQTAPGDSAMVSMCRRALALVFPLLALAGLAGCNRGQGVVYQESASDDKPTAEKVIRGVADTGDGGETKKGDEEGFRFPNDKGGEVLARVLAPSVDVRAVRVQVQKPRRQPAPASLEAPSLALPPAQPAMPRVALEWKRPLLLPRLVIDETLGGGAEPSPAGGAGICHGSQNPGRRR